MKIRILFSLAISLLLACQGVKKPETQSSDSDDVVENKSVIERNLEKYVSVPLTADLSSLSENQKKMIPIFIEVAQIMDAIFWKEAYGEADGLLSSLDNELEKNFVRINYGPWDRLAGNKPFIDGVGDKPAGANFYPAPSA